LHELLLGGLRRIKDEPGAARLPALKDLFFGIVFEIYVLKFFFAGGWRIKSKRRHAVVV
jgi:hypothetical protein